MKKFPAYNGEALALCESKVQGNTVGSCSVLIFGKRKRRSDFLTSGMKRLNSLRSPDHFAFSDIGDQVQCKSESWSDPVDESGS